eukprot:TRINITY_DN1925_c0_g1_i2.p1 TRINITY_DN1925_c0_g1~~TRINITY_DN1925_c0_g1_i2.p1  ORF type:complete len:494 (+),score=83.67 TRINITY_DN1925_c0_g1_i2:157-1638(+)
MCIRDRVSTQSTGGLFGQMAAYERITADSAHACIDMELDQVASSTPDQDLVGLVEVGSFIVAAPGRRDSFSEGVYLITRIDPRGGVDGSAGITAVNITTQQIEPTQILTDKVYQEVNQQLDKHETHVQVVHYLGGSYMEEPAFACSWLQATAPEEVEATGWSDTLEGGVLITGNLKDVAASAAEDARRRGSTIEVKCVWGCVRWSRVQLLGELARGDWGMCRASATDIFPVSSSPSQDPGLWSSLVSPACNRLLYTLPGRPPFSPDQFRRAALNPEEGSIWHELRAKSPQLCATQARPGDSFAVHADGPPEKTGPATEFELRELRSELAAVRGQVSQANQAREGEVVAEIASVHQGVDEDSLVVGELCKGTVIKVANHSTSSSGEHRAWLIAPVEGWVSTRHIRAIQAPRLHETTVCYACPSAAVDLCSYASCGTPCGKPLCLAHKAQWAAQDFSGGLRSYCLEHHESMFKVKLCWCVFVVIVVIIEALTRTS